MTSFSLAHTVTYMHNFYVHTHRESSRAQKHTPTDTHRERAVLCCSIRLSMPLILISRKGKSLLEVVGAGGESSLSLLHTPAQRDSLLLLMCCLWKTHFKWIMLLLKSYVWYHSELCRVWLPVREFGEWRDRDGIQTFNTIPSSWGDHKKEKSVYKLSNVSMS